MIIIISFRSRIMSLDLTKPPQLPLSAYAFFFKETQASIKSKQPNATFESCSQIVESMWQSLADDQKEKYRKMNEADKERYRQEKEAHDRAASGGGATTVVKVSAPAPAPVEAGTVRCIRSGCNNPR